MTAVGRDRVQIRKQSVLKNKQTKKNLFLKQKCYWSKEKTQESSVYMCFMPLLVHRCRFSKLVDIISSSFFFFDVFFVFKLKPFASVII